VQGHGGEVPSLCTAVFDEHAASVFGVAIDEEAKVIVSASGDKTAKLWTPRPWLGVAGQRDQKTPRCMASTATLRHATDVNCVSVAGGAIITGSDDGWVRVWSLDTLECIQSLEHGGGMVMATRILGTILVSGGQDASVKVWALGGNASLNSTGVHEGVCCDASGMDPIVGVRYRLKGPSSDYDLCEAEFRKLSVADQSQYEALSPPVAVLTLHEDPVRGLAITSDGKILSAGFEGVLALWHPSGPKAQAQGDPLHDPVDL
jgi:WD40 repeat protein